MFYPTRRVDILLSLGSPRTQDYMEGLSLNRLAFILINKKRSVFIYLSNFQEDILSRELNLGRSL